MKLQYLSLALASALLSVPAAAQQQSSAPADKPPSPSDACCPTHDHAQQPDEHAKMNERGEHGMGFSQTATTHHFLLKPDGGVIQVEAKDPKDTASVGHIRMHLTHISHAFAAGDFDIPMFVHDTVPPGVPDMKRLADKITYTFEQTPNGGRVVIHSSDSAAISAIHKFLRFQIDEHQTHDPTTLD